MSIDGLTALFATKPLAALVAVLVFTVLGLFIAWWRSQERRIREAQAAGNTWAKMAELHNRTLDLHERTLAILEDSARG